MAINFSGLYTELENFTASVWTDCVSGGTDYIREADDVAALPFEHLIEEHLPFGVIVFQSPQPLQMGEANRCYRLPVEFWYVARVTLGSSALWTKAEAMAGALWTEARDTTPSLITLAQIWPDPLPCPVWGVSQPVNRFLREKKLGILASGCMATLYVGESP